MQQYYLNDLKCHTSYPIHGIIWIHISSRYSWRREVPVLRAAVGVEDPREALALVDVMQFHQGLLGRSRKHLLGFLLEWLVPLPVHGQQNPWQKI